MGMGWLWKANSRNWKLAK